MENSIGQKWVKQRRPPLRKVCIQPSNSPIIQVGIAYIWFGEAEICMENNSGISKHQ